VKWSSAVSDVILDASTRRRAIASRLVLGALREQDAAHEAGLARDRAQHLAQASRDLSRSLDENDTRDVVRKLTLPRDGAWTIVDVVEPDGSIARLEVEHPDPAKRVLAQMLQPNEALVLPTQGDRNRQVLREIGFGAMLVVPLVVRGRIQGTITFLSRADAAPFTPEEIALAVDLGARSAIALDNARLLRESDMLRLLAEKANQSKDDLLRSVSHELRTPLNAIGGFADVMGMGLQGPVNADQQSALGRIKANQQHLLMLITDILNAVRAGSAPVYEIVEVPLRAALADASDMLSGQIAERGLILDGPRGEPNVVAAADGSRVRQILMNVIMNAVKYMPRNGGSITLTCEVLGDMVAAHVSDTGRGIPAEELESIFEPFVQLISSAADRREGIGLGLAISRDLARAMKGELTVESTVGVGSRFTLTLPRAQASQRAVDTFLH
jgi:signal transduction histidine kinase